MKISMLRLPLTCHQPFLPVLYILPPFIRHVEHVSQRGVLLAEPLFLEQTNI